MKSLQDKLHEASKALEEIGFQHVNFFVEAKDKGSRAEISFEASLKKFHEFKGYLLGNAAHYTNIDVEISEHEGHEDKYKISLHPSFHLKHKEEREKVISHALDQLIKDARNYQMRR